MRYAIAPFGAGVRVGARAIEADWPLVSGESFTIPEDGFLPGMRQEDLPSAANARTAPEGGMLQVISRNDAVNGAYTVGVKAKDITVGPGLYADFNGSVGLPAAIVGDFTLVHLYLPASGPVQAIAKLARDANQPDPARSRVISAFGTYNFADSHANWGVNPAMFTQTGRDLWFSADASIEGDWALPTITEGWQAKALDSWIPTGFAELGRFRLEVGSRTQGNAYVQANIAPTTGSFCAQEVKGYSPFDGNNKYVVQLKEVPLLGNKIWLCGYNARIALLCAGYRLNS